MWRLLACRGCGSTIVELALELAGIPYVREEHNYEQPEGRAALLAHNPLGQVPTLILPDGLVMTESAAILQVIDEHSPCGLLPPIGDPLRREALHWLTFIVAAIYPTFTYGDDVARWGAGEALQRTTDAHREKLWRHLEALAHGPWFLSRFSAIDLYIAVMSHWRPRRAWFAEHAPKLDAIARAVERDARFTAVLAANFPG